MYTFNPYDDITKYILEGTSIEYEVHKTFTYLIETYIYKDINSHDTLKVSKVNLPLGVIYCIPRY